MITQEEFNKRILELISLSLFNKTGTFLNPVDIKKSRDELIVLKEDRMLPLNQEETEHKNAK